MEYYPDGKKVCARGKKELMQIYHGYRYLSLLMPTRKKKYLKIKGQKDYFLVLI